MWFKYIWIVILVIIYIKFTISAIEDIVYVLERKWRWRKEKQKCDIPLDIETTLWLTIHIVFIFVASLTYWLTVTFRMEG